MADAPDPATYSLQLPQLDTKLILASATRTCCPPGLRVKWVSTRRYRPHSQRATGCKRKYLHHTIPHGKTLDHNSGARGAPRLHIAALFPKVDLAQLYDMALVGESEDCLTCQHTGP
ncbi:Hypothetical predicted protein [Pelobates cultripes]|nr:Hypothetical predicted protein [Pelobates cultripes]